MQNQQDVASLYASNAEKRLLWKAAIKWPLYSVAVMPVLLAAGWRFNAGQIVRLDQLVGFLIASILLLLWENLTNDLFDADTGIDEFNKPHSVVALLGNKQPVRRLAYAALFLGLALIMLLAFRSNPSVLFLVLGSCALGYLYQGPPFRLGYHGLGEPLCWIAFGPFATAAALLVLSPSGINPSNIPWRVATTLGAGPALATTLVLFCSHFHQVAEDSAHGKRSPLVRLGTKRSAKLIPWLLALIMTLELIPIMQRHWPITALLGLIGLPSGIALVRLLSRHHNHPERVSGSKFLALHFQALNGLGLSVGLALGPVFGISLVNQI
ncbi:2-carboxy-1,4-naphthoquinone phytyltransferase [Prochlorococcus sp. MIT 1307]|uniref:2-carboxy-1,4-naphthoquinone phytyltransferase n=1 Tax=Prochlorococcus sp. MIT 1307 TaxID=3096219 RepID=UPI002A7606F3|nr:2-carboxy-1,4-naphthoquinone phytyltransferase [Prochlorococcus sp. MIT 1307]